MLYGWFKELQVPVHTSRRIRWITVYRRKWAYRFKTAFPEPYLLQKRSISAENKLSDREWHQKVSKIISSINYMKKRAMQRNNRENIRQKSNSHTFVDDADFLKRDTLFIALTSTDDYTTKKINFFEQFGLFRNCFFVFCKEFMWKMIYMHFTDRIIRYSLCKWHGKENNLARDPIFLWLRSLYGYWHRFLYAISYFYNL